MATQAQIEANRANAQKSTGPKTEEGKTKSALNHLSHGFTSHTQFIGAGESKRLEHVEAGGPALAISERDHVYGFHRKP